MSTTTKEVVEFFGGKYLLGGALIQFGEDSFNEMYKEIYDAAMLTEREACAALCFSIWNEWLDTPEEDRYKVLYDAEDCAAAIRARGTT